MPEVLRGILQLLRACERIVIATHVRPDGDAIGSQLALGLFLQKQGKRVSMINEHRVPATLDWMDGAEQIEVYAGSVAQREAIQMADVFVAVDFNALTRLGEKLVTPVQASPAIKVLVDHHCEPEAWFDYAWVREEAAATGMLIYELLTAWDASLVTGPVATALYVSILTDTGSFRFSSVTPALHRMVADLLERGDRTPSEVYSAIYECRSRIWPRLLGRILNTLTFGYDDRLAYIFITCQMLRELDAKQHDADLFVDYALSVEGVEVALVFTETKRGTKVGFRSKGHRAVNAWARAFGGGGHRFAAGAFVELPLDETIDQVVQAAPKHTGLSDAAGADVLSQDDEAYLSMLVGS